MQQDLPEPPSAAFNPAQAMGCLTDVTEIVPVSPAAGSARQPADHLGPKQQGTLQAPPLPAPDAAHTSSDQTATLSTHYAGTGSRGECDQHLQLQQLAGADAAALVTHCAAGGCCTAAVQRECSPPDAAAGAAPYASWAGCGTAGQGQSSSPASSSQEALWHNQQHCDPQEPYHQFHDRQQQWQQQHSPLHLQQQGVLPVSAAQQQQQQLEGLVHGQQKQDHEQDLGREDQQQYHQQQQQLRELLQRLQASCNKHQRQEDQQPELPRPVEEAGAPGGATGPHCVHHQQQQEPPQQQPRQQQQRQQQQQSPQPQPPSSHDSEALLVGDTSADTTQGQQDQQLPPASATAAAVAAVVEYVAVAIRSAQAQAAEEYNAEEQQQSGEQAATPPAAASATASASAAVVVNAYVLGPAAAGAEDSGTAAAAAADSQGQQQLDVSAAAAAANCEDTAAQCDALEEEEAAAAAAEVCSEDAECSVDEGSAPSDPLDRLLQLAEVAAQQFGVPADAAAAAGGDTAAPRWVANNEIWTSEDGLTVWPKDSPITPTPRVFYLTFKWVADHWPGPAAEATGTSSTHVTSTTAELYLDGEPCRITMPAKIRLYSRAVHLVLSPYSKLSKAFPRKWLAGYAYDSKRDRVRLYLSTLKPRPPQLPAEPKPPKAPKPKAAAAAAGGSNGDPAGSSKQAVRKRKRGEPLQPPSQHPGLPLPVMGMLEPLMPLPMRPGRGSGGGVVSITWGKASARGTQAPPPAMAVAPPVVLVRPHPCRTGGPLPIPTAAAGSAAGGGGGSASGPVLHQMPPSASQQWLQQQQQMRQQQLWRQQQQQQYQQQLGVQRVPAGQTQPAPLQQRSDQQRVVPRQIVFLQKTPQLRPALPPQWQQVVMAQQQPQAAVLQRQLQQQQQLFPPCMQQQQQVVVPLPPPQHHQQQQAGLVQLLQLPVAMRQPQHDSLHHQQQQQQMALSTVGEQQHKVPAEQPPPPQPGVVTAEGPITS